MSQININTVPVILIRIPKKTAEISWQSDVAVREKCSLGSKKIRLDKGLKKNK